MDRKLIKLNKRLIVIVSILILYISLSAVNAEKVTGNVSSNKITNSNNVATNHVLKSPSSFSDNSRTAKKIIITNSSYFNYFNVYTGRILPSADIVTGDTICIGNVTDKAFTIDRKLTLTTICDGDRITNGVIHLIAGSDGSIVTGLNITNDKTVYKYNGIEGIPLNGIWLTNSSYNTISYNYAKVANALKVFAMPMGWSSYNTIVYNKLISTWSSCMPMGQCHYNNISNNYLQVTNANIIYYNPFGHGDYGGSALCVGNYISNNYLYSVYISDLVVGMLLSYASNDNTMVVNNTIAHVFTAISLTGDSVTIHGNHIINDLYDSAISVVSDNATISNNVINVKSAYLGITAESKSANSVIIVKNNNITFNEGCTQAITVDTNSKVYNNTINLPIYGKGIVGSGWIANNTINAKGDPAIQITGGNSKIIGNKITTGSYGIYIISLTNRIYDNTIMNNTITSTLYGIFLNGLIYNTTISGNKIYTSASKGIYKNITDVHGDDSSDNTVNGIINDATAIVVDDSNYYKYFDKNGYLNFKSFKSDAVIILTHLTGKNLKFNQKVSIISNGLSNLLINVCITLYSDASGSTLKELNFYNTNLNGIILADGTKNINITANNMTILSDTNFTGSLSGILSYGACEFVNITKNTIYMNSNNGYIYGINAVSSSQTSLHLANDFSKYFIISNNNIILIGNKLAEGIYTDSLINSTINANNINVVGGLYGYGIATSNVIGYLHDLIISSNTIIVNVKSMAYLIELHMCQNISVVNNSLYGTGSGVYGISAYRTSSVTIKSNKIQTTGGNLSLTDPNNNDVLGNGNAAIYLTANTDTTNILLNTIYTNAATQINTKKHQTQF